MRRATVADVSTERPDWREFLGLDDAALLRQCDFDRFRASGPGGQKRNVTDSAVRLRHRPSGVSAEAHESRSQHENRARALRRLRHSIALQLRAPVTLEDYTPARELAAARTKDRRLVLGRRDARYRAGAGLALRCPRGRAVATERGGAGAPRHECLAHALHRGRSRRLACAQRAPPRARAVVAARAVAASRLLKNP